MPLAICGICGWVNVRRITKFPDNLDDGALSAFCRHFGRGKKIDTFLLVQRANHDLKLRIGEDAGQSENSRRKGAACPMTGNKSASIAFALIARLPLRFPAVTGFCPIGTSVMGLTKGKLAPIQRALPFLTFRLIQKLPRLPTLNGPSSQSKPSSFRLFWVISTNFDSISTCFGLASVHLLNDGIDQVQIVLRVTHDQAAALREKICACAGWKCDPLRFQEFLRSFATHELAFRPSIPECPWPCQPEGQFPALLW